MVLLYPMLPPQLIRSVLHFIQRPDATPSLHPHYRNFVTTTSCSAPVPCIGTLTLVALTTWISPFTSRHLVPAVPYKSPDQTHAIYTPDTAHPITRFPMSLSQGMETPLVLMPILWLTTRQQWFRSIRLSDPHLPSYNSHFTSMLMTTTLNESHLKWFEACFWKPTSKGLPSSSIELIHKTLVYHMTNLSLVRLRRTFKNPFFRERNFSIWR